MGSIIAIGGGTKTKPADKEVSDREEEINVMVNGLPGKMASVVADSIIIDPRLESPGIRLVSYSLTGPDIIQEIVMRGACIKHPIHLIKPEERDEEIKRVMDLEGSFISVDYTHPSAVNENADFYCRNKLPFVIGTTGGDRKALEERVKNSEISAVIAPNMAKQIVAFQAMMQYAAETFPDSFKGYKLEIKESHQKGKADTSGTAKAMVGHFNKLGIPFTKGQIIMVREPEEQLKMGVPEGALTGHGWHTYTLKSDDETILFQFTHNVNGRDIYALGTIDAIKYLDRKVKEGSKGRVYSMIDVLKGA